MPKQSDSTFWPSRCRCSDCEEEDGCIECADRVMSGQRPSGSFLADIRMGFRDGEDPMDVVSGRKRNFEEDSKVAYEDIGGITNLSDIP
jgi:hypothetical protein